jgi:hypothetical protein
VAYNSATTELYLTGGDGGYNVTTADFLPTFAMFTKYAIEGQTPQVKWNDEDVFDFYFEKIVMQEDLTLPPTIEKYDAISCQSYIDGPYWDAYSTEERNDVKS